MYLPKKYHIYERIYDLEGILENCLNTMQDMGIAPKNIVKEYHNEDDIFEEKPIIIKLRSSKYRQKWEAQPKINLIFLEQLRVMDSPNVLVVKLNERLKNGFYNDEKN